MPLDVALLGDVVGAQGRRLAQLTSDSIRLHPVGNSLPLAERFELLANCDAAIAVEFDLPARELTRLKLLQVAAAGYERVNFSCLSKSVWVCNAVGHGPAVAEYVLAALLATNLGLYATDASFRAGSWSRRGSTYRPLRYELSSRKVGVLGYGHIGQAVVRACAALDVSTVVCTRSRPVDGDFDSFRPLHAWMQFLQEIDYLVVCLAHTPETEGFIDAEKLASMKPTSVVINVSRGALIDETALFEALSTGAIGGAVLDTWWRYPSESAPDARPSSLSFETLPNVTMTPHISAWTEQALDRRWRAIAANLAALEAGSELRNVIRKAEAA